jgi:hypothetical protein
MSDRAIRWRLDRGGWTSIHHAVYLTVAARDDWHTTALAAELAAIGATMLHSKRP